MIDRTTNPRSRPWANYGGRGITVCDRWRNDFAAFFSDMGPRPSPKHSLDRINNARGYEPGNVKWATRGEQSRNSRRNRFYTVDGITLCITDWAMRLGFSKGAMQYRFDHLSPDEAVHRPLRRTA